MKKKLFSIVILFLIATIFFYSFLSRIWVAEDAYITFRHILNFQNGYGLTFNKTEKLEGFTHPLWTILLIILSSTGFSLHFASLILGAFFSTAGMFLLFYNFIYKNYKLNFFSRAILIIPFFFVIHDGFRDFWTSGLEFSLTFFLLSIFLILIANQRIKNYNLLSLIFALLYLTRPELGLIFAYYGLILLFDEKNLFSRKIITYTLIFALISGSYHLFRWSYYNEIFPNTFYAKSSELMWKEGIYYIWHSLYYSPLLIPSLIFFLIYSFYKKYLNYYFIRETGFMVLHLIYLISIGGDFMAYRLLLPDLAILYVYLFIIFNEWFKDNQKIIITANILLFIAAYYFIFYFSAKKRFHTPIAQNLIVHEYRAYFSENQNWKEKWFKIDHKWYDRGLAFRELQKCLSYEPFIITNSWLDAKCAPEDDYGLGYFGFAAGPNVIIIDQLGITDKEVARTGKTVWRRVGHMKSINLERVIQRKVLFCSLNDERYDSLMKTNFGVVINLSPEFLSLLDENYERKIHKLKELYRTVKNSTNEKDQSLFKKLLLIEETYNIKIENLPEKKSFTKNSYNRCWQKPVNIR